jgi:hypothetical protein
MAELVGCLLIRGNTCLSHNGLFGWFRRGFLGGRVEFAEDGTERQQARRKREFVVVDKAADSLDKRFEFVVEKIDPRQAFLLKALEFRLAAIGAL